MKLRPYRLSQLDMGDFALAGYSVAGEESVVVVPELDCVFDIGRCPREALQVNHVLLTHGHAVHVAGILYYFAQRDFQGVMNGTALVPANLVGPLEELVAAWGRVEGHAPPHRFVGMAPGADYPVRRGLTARAFATCHVPGSLGFSLIDIRNKLKQEYLGLAGPEIVELKKQGVEVTRRVEVPLVAYLGDTSEANYADLPYVAEARVLLVECTFFDAEHVSRARAGKHLHVTDLPSLLDGMHNERIVICHVTRRTNIAAARKILRQTLPEEVLPRVTFLMSGRHVGDG